MTVSMNALVHRLCWPGLLGMPVAGARSEYKPEVVPGFDGSSHCACSKSAVALTSRVRHSSWPAMRALESGFSWLLAGTLLDALDLFPQPCGGLPEYIRCQRALGNGIRIQECRPASATSICRPTNLRLKRCAQRNRQEASARLPQNKRTAASCEPSSQETAVPTALSGESTCSFSISSQARIR